MSIPFLLLGAILLSPQQCAAEPASKREHLSLRQAAAHAKSPRPRKPFLPVRGSRTGSDRCVPVNRSDAGLPLVSRRSPRGQHPPCNPPSGASDQGEGGADLLKWLIMAAGFLTALLVLRQAVTSRTAVLLAEVELRARREKDLEREKRLIDNVIESLPSLFYAYDRERFVRWNSAFSTVLGLSEEELSGGLTLSMVHEQDRELEYRKRLEILETGEAEWEVRLVTGKGVRLHHVTGKRMEHDGAVYAVAIASDIADQRLARMALDESERRYWEILENLRLIAVMFDSQDRVTFCNDFLLELTGWSREEVLGRNWFQMFYPDPGESCSTFHEAIGHGRVSFHRERAILTRQGGRRLISWNSTLLRNPEGEEVGAALIGEDITDRMQYQTALNSITSAVSAATGADFLQSLVTHLAQALELECAAVSRLEPCGTMMTTVAISCNGEILKNFTYAIAGSPCEGLESCGRIIPAGLCAHFPEVPFIQQNELESYAGVPLKGPDGELLGSLVVLGKTPFASPELVEGIIGIFGVRAAAEMGRSRADLALKESEKRYRLLFDKMINGYAVWEVLFDEQGGGADYRFLEVNASFKALTRYKRGSLIGRTLRELLPQSEDVWIDRLAAVAISGRPEQFDAYSPHLRKWLKVAVYRPQLGLVAATFADITKRKRAEKALIESEEHVRQIFAQSDDGLILFELDTFNIIEANPAAVKLYGTSSDEFQGLKPWSVISPSDFRKLIRIISKQDVRAGFQMDRATCYRSDGSSFPVSIRGKILMLRNEYVILCSVRDITEKTRLEDEMKATQARLIQANKMSSLGMLASGIAHEINNPNNFISVNALTLADVWKDVAPILEEFREQHGEYLLAGLPSSEMESVVPRLLAGISEGSTRISGIVSNMRNFVRRNDGGAEAAFDVNQTVSSAVSLLWHHVRRHTERFQLELADDLPPACGSGQQIEQVIINLVMNALQALPDKQSRVMVTSSLDGEGGMLEISVIDEGCGMKKSVLRQLTEPFFSTKTESGGTGLGLYISDSIVKGHNGTLTFSSALGKGTVATIRLPVAGRGARPLEGDEAL